MARPVPRPTPFSVGSVRVAVVSGRKPRDDRWYWRARRFAEGGEQTVWTGWATRPEAEIEVARLVGGVPMTPSASTTVGEVMDYWLGAQIKRTDLRPRSLETMTAAAKSIDREIGMVRAGALTAATLERYRDARLRPGLTIVPRKKNAEGKVERGRLPSRTGAAPATVSRELRMLRVAWVWAHEHGFVASPILPKTQVRHRDVVDRYTPTPIEVARVLAKLHGWPALAVRLCFATGARLGEIAGLVRRDIDEEAGVVRVDGKTGKRAIPVAPQVLASVLPLLPTDPDARVLGVEPSSVLTSLRRYLTDACAEAGVRRWTAHALRRLAVDLLYRAGVDVGTAASVMGHTPTVALRHYRRASQDDRSAAVRLARLGVLPDTDEAAKVVNLPSGRRT